MARATIKWGKHSDRHLPVGGNKLCQKQTRFNLALWGAATEHGPCARMFPFIKMSVHPSARLGNFTTFPALFKTLLVYNIWSAGLFRYLILNDILRAWVSLHKTNLFFYQTNSVQASYLVSPQKCEKYYVRYLETSLFFKCLVQLENFAIYTSLFISNVGICSSHHQHSLCSVRWLGPMCIVYHLFVDYPVILPRQSSVLMRMTVPLSDALHIVYY